MGFSSILGVECPCNKQRKFLRIFIAPKGKMKNKYAFLNKMDIKSFFSWRKRFQMFFERLLQVCLTIVFYDYVIFCLKTKRTPHHYKIARFHIFLICYICICMQQLKYFETNRIWVIKDKLWPRK